jgi:hypothetical protein
VLLEKGAEGEKDREEVLVKGRRRIVGQRSSELGS